MNNQKKKTHIDEKGICYKLFSRLVNNETFQENRKRYISILLPHEKIMAMLLRSVEEEED